MLFRFKFICLMGDCDTNLSKNINLEPSGELRSTVSDGVVLGPAGRDAHLVINPKHIFDPTYIVDNVIRVSDRFIIHKKTRDQLKRYLYEHLPSIAQDRARKGKNKKKMNI